MKKMILLAIAVIGLTASCKKKDVAPKDNITVPVPEPPTPIIDTLETINITFSGQYNGKLGNITKLIFVNGQVKETGTKNYFEVKCEIGDTISILSNFMVPSQYNNSAWVRVSLNDINSFNINDWIYIITPTGSQTVQLKKDYIVI